jgi:hypothetical protein
MSSNKNRKFPAEIAIPLSLVVIWFLYNGKTIGRHGGVSRIDDPHMYWGMVTVLVGIILYKIVEYFDLQIQKTGLSTSQATLSA